jgi:hypothetical protein
MLVPAPLVLGENLLTHIFESFSASIRAARSVGPGSDRTMSAQAYLEIGLVVCALAGERFGANACTDRGKW